ncbi:Hpt domain-containing protein [Desulfosediminicola flagellatus]|uniref:hybrid sensor histidine kinase/response regulator n=1 Tax=Desulfosediminicola flagellatus TaxID=2569541 RepID=UPI0010AD24F8|nr:Hpt domain-containing protein [Desulfosediminicola flagellatus]
MSQSPQSKIAGILFKEIEGYLPEIELAISILQETSADFDILSELYRLFHNIKGAASQLQYTGLSHSAGLCEAVVADLLEGENTEIHSHLDFLDNVTARICDFCSLNERTDDAQELLFTKALVEFNSLENHLGEDRSIVLPDYIQDALSVESRNSEKSKETGSPEHAQIQLNQEECLYDLRSIVPLLQELTAHSSSGTSSTIPEDILKDLSSAIETLSECVRCAGLTQHHDLLSSFLFILHQLQDSPELVDNNSSDLLQDFLSYVDLVFSMPPYEGELVIIKIQDQLSSIRDLLLSPEAEGMYNNDKGSIGSDPNIYPPDELTQDEQLTTPADSLDNDDYDVFIEGNATEEDIENKELSFQHVEYDNDNAEDFESDIEPPEVYSQSNHFSSEPFTSPEPESQSPSDEIDTLQEEDELILIFRSECDEHLQTIKTELLTLENAVSEPGQMNSDTLESLNIIRHGVHTLKGAAAITGFTDIADSSHALEELLDWIHDDSNEIMPGDIALIAEAIDYIESLSSSLQGNSSDKRVPILLPIEEYLQERRDSDLADSISQDSLIVSSTEGQSPDSSIYESNSEPNETGSLAELNIFSQIEAENQLSQITQFDSTTDESGISSADSSGMSEEEEQELLSIFQAECEEQLGSIHSQLNPLSLEIQATTILTPALRETLSSIRRSIHTIKGAAAMTGFDNLARCAHEVEDLLDWLHDSSSTIKPIDITVTAEAVEFIETLTQSESLSDSDNATLIAEAVASHLLNRSNNSDESEDALEPSYEETLDSTIDGFMSNDIAALSSAEFEVSPKPALEDSELPEFDDDYVFDLDDITTPEIKPDTAVNDEHFNTTANIDSTTSSIDDVVVSDFEQTISASFEESSDADNEDSLAEGFENAAQADIEDAIAICFDDTSEESVNAPDITPPEETFESSIEEITTAVLENTLDSQDLPEIVGKEIDTTSSAFQTSCEDTTTISAEADIFSEIDEQDIVTDLAFAAPEESDDMISDVDGMTKEEHEELLAIFQAECEEHLQTINENLNTLVTEVAVTSIVNSALRETLSSLRRGIHTIKGAAAMTGFDNLATCAHEVEDLLDWLHDSSSDITPEDVAIVAEATDLIETLTQTDNIDDTKKVTHIAEALARHLFLRSNKIYEDLESSELTAEDSTHSIHVPEEVTLAEESADPALKDFSATPSEELVEPALVDYSEPDTEQPPESTHTETVKLLAEDTEGADYQATTPVDTILSADSVIPAAKEIRFKRAPELKIDTSTLPTDTGNVRVKLHDLDELVNIEGDLVVARGSIEKLMEKFSDSLSELNTIKDTLKRKSQELEIGFEAQSLYGFGSGQLTDSSSGNDGINANLSDFDPIELDRYSQLNLIIRSLNELSIDVNAIHQEMSTLGSSLESQVVKQQLSMAMMQEKLMRIRMTPLSSISRMMFRTVRQTAKRLNKKVNLSVIGEDVFMDRFIWARTIDPLMHILRNCVDHGIEDADLRNFINKPQTGQITLEANQRGRFVVLKISDDGRGIDIEKLKAKLIAENIIPSDSTASDQDLLPYIFRPSVSTRDDISQISGRGVGLDVVQRNIQELRGTVQVINSPEEGVTFELSIPITLSVNRAVIVDLASRQFAVPIQDITEVRKFKQSETDPANPSNVIYKDKSIPLIQLKQKLQIPISSEENLYTDVLTLVVNTGEELVAMQIDRVDDQREIVIKDLGSHLHYVKGINGVTLTGEGTIIPILNLRELSVADQQEITPEIVTIEGPATQGPLKVLVVDDSISVRFSITRLVKNQSWEAIQAIDGIDALEKLEEITPDVIILDIEMPRMNGYELLGMLRSNEAYSKIPVIMLTSRASEKHRKKAEELGARHYMTKPFQEDYFIELLSSMQQSH